MENPVRILHVDDDVALARLLQKALGRRGFEVDNATDIESALQRIAADEVDVVVLDHYLAGHTGLELLSRLADVPLPPPVVYVTGSSDASIAIDALKAGATDYVLKTVGDDFFVLLAGAIEKAYRKARLQRAKEQAEAEVRTARDRAELLLTEVNHRVANSLALVAALVRMQSGAIQDPSAKGVLAETEARISAIAGLHRKLYTSDDVRSVALDEYLSGLVAELDNSMRAAGHRMRTALHLETLHVPPDKAVSVGMIVTELLTNAYKYAYPKGSEGEVRVIVRRETHTEAELLVEDDGIGWSGEGKPQGTGLGTRIVRSMAVTLGSEIIYLTDRPGTRVSLKLPIEADGAIT
ncbi:sensor histidine kinase [Chelativorans sp. ZYF759]|uniref:sensor histidine kinase n=1 Tax=Chelativorans sp. ZYF759 TaxID=2692213 RepID=UPI001FF05997|nr:response regulator [Chelativorans sp. ZYF759]